MLHLQGVGDPDDILEKQDLEAERDQSAAAGESLSRSVDAFLRTHAPCTIGSHAAAVSQVGRRRGKVKGVPARRVDRNKRTPRTSETGDDGGGEAPMGPHPLSDEGRGCPASATEPRLDTGTSVVREEAGGGVPAVEGAAGVAAARITLIVSLSGGVDSMVLVHILLALRTRYGHNFNVAAVHIDYSNRKESAAEAAFLQRWCKVRGVDLRVRVITEFKRAVTARDEYEKESRRIRFEAYAEAMEATGAPAVFFGHHEGDLQENVISNVMKGAQLLNVAGISAASRINGVLIWRPMLEHPKDDIYQYAHTYGVPYFKDTTPAWSNRGKLRNQLLPLLKEVYGEGLGAHLTAFAKESAQCRMLVQPQLLEPLWNSVQASPIAIWADLAPFAQMPVFFWREALRHMCEAMLGSGLVKEQPVLLLIERLRRPEAKRKDGWLALKKDNRALLVGNCLVLFRSPTFPGRHEGRVWQPRPHAEPGTALEAPRGGRVTVHRLGPWTVTLSRTTDAPTPVAAGVGERCPALLWEMLTGVPARSGAGRLNAEYSAPHVAGVTVALASQPTARPTPPSALLLRPLAVRAPRPVGVYGWLGDGTAGASFPRVAGRGVGRSTRRDPAGRSRR